MSETDYLTILVMQSLGVAQSIQPLIPPMFSPAQFPALPVGAGFTPIPRPSLPIEETASSRPPSPDPTIPRSTIKTDISRPSTSNLTIPHAVEETTSSRPPAPQITHTSTVHGELAFGRDEAVPTFNDATDISSKNKPNSLQPQALLSISRTISQIPTSHTFQNIHVMTPTRGVTGVGAIGDDLRANGVNLQSPVIEPAHPTSTYSTSTHGRGMSMEPVPTRDRGIVELSEGRRNTSDSTRDRGIVGSSEGRRDTSDPTFNGESQVIHAYDATNVLPKNNATSSQILPPVPPVSPILPSVTESFSSHASQPTHAETGSPRPPLPTSSSSSRPTDPTIPPSLVGTGVSRPLEPVRVTIGRVEVRATPPVQEPSKRAQVARTAQPTFSLQEYLEQRRSGKL